MRRSIFPTLPGPLPLASFSAGDDLRAAVGLWAAWLTGERRASAHTIAAYGRDLAIFLDFLTKHLGAPPSLMAIGTLRPADFRAYLARRAGEGIERSSLARGVSVLRGFVRFLQRRGLASTTALSALIYGCGLRLSEALGLTREEAPAGETLTIIGKGRKERQLSVLPAVRT